MKNIDNFGLSLTNKDSTKKINLNEIDIVEIVDSGILDSIPYLSEIISTYKGVMNLRDKIFTKKFIRFLQSFENQTISEKEYNDFTNRIVNDKNYRIKITETLIEYIDNFKNTSKIEVYSNLLTAYIENKFSWEYFIKLSDCLEKVDMHYLNIIPQIDTTENKEIQQYDEDETTGESNLESSGLAIRMSVWSSDIYPTKYGRDIYKYGLRKTTL
ncbi:hypothetical protein [Elizabethkingia anophelis]|uniref:hypothetical protein n=1 Tax=Elizabethkingia anophelis TaxID=1117645 RepID=UPI0012B2251B|nr:hypothetical protein [Elizabethkingia anophelis]MCT3719885.1 hypothetical protein [Elizabethkingia anophelis]MCT3723395.1 hypothetical protein [Elizabethkingia anophelis]MCT3776533.1 hypothetical protein [Elizabethkingia anophelis]MCT3783646.1 hypothetical protein [Elizabethkingia anophelis]MCT3790963.1 hypothetical protein [Elizabethkingia anophelis]